MKRFKILFPVVAAAYAMFTAGMALHETYQYSHKPSPLQLAMQRAGFNNTQQQALVKILFYSGYLEPQKLWQDSVEFEGITGVNAYQLYHSIIATIKHSKQNWQLNSASEPNSKLLVKNLFKDIDLPADVVAAWVVYITQNAFGRKAGEERNVLSNNNSMDTLLREKQLQAFKELGLIDEISPKLSQYSGVWILGGSFVKLIKRIEDFKVKLNNKIVGEITILAGERPLCVELDGEEVMLKLAQGMGIPFNQENPFIRNQNRTYLNYEKPLTETEMAAYLNDQLLNGKATVIDTKAENNQRPTTETTARDAGKALIAKIQQGEYKEQKDISIAVVSDQPYILRQTISVNRVVQKLFQESKLNEAGYKIKVEGCGPGVDLEKANPQAINSENAALVGEALKDILLQSQYKDSMEQLFYQHRKSLDPATLPPMPEDQTPEITWSGLLVHWWDMITE